MIYNSEGAVPRPREPEHERISEDYPLKIRLVPMPNGKPSSNLYTLGHYHDPDAFRAACTAFAPGIDFSLCSSPLEQWWKPMRDGYLGYERASASDDDAFPVTFIQRGEK